MKRISISSSRLASNKNKVPLDQHNLDTDLKDLARYVRGVLGPGLKTHRIIRELDKCLN